MQSPSSAKPINLKEKEVKIRKRKAKAFYRSKSRTKTEVPSMAALAKGSRHPEHLRGSSSQEQKALLSSFGLR